MNRIQTAERLAGCLAPAGRGGRWLFVFAGLFFLILSGFCGVFQPAVENADAFISVADYPDTQEEALRSNPLPPLQCAIRTGRFQRTITPLKLSPAALPAAPLLLICGAFAVICPAAFLTLKNQNGLCTSIFVRAGPLCFEKITTFQNKQNTRKYDYERFSEKKFGSDHLLRFLHSADYCRVLRLQDGFLRGMAV